MLESQMMLQVFICKREQVPLREDIPRCKMHSFPAFFFFFVIPVIPVFMVE